MKNKPFCELPIEEKFKQLFEEYKRSIEEQVLFNVLTRFYFADWTRQCDYEKMTQEEIVNAVINECKKIEQDWKYDIDSDLFSDPFLISYPEED